MNRSSFMDVRDNGVSEAASKLVHREVAATMVNHGKGKIGAVYGPIPTLYFNGHHPFLRRFVGDIVKQLFPILLSKRMLLRAWILPLGLPHKDN